MLNTYTSRIALRLPVPLVHYARTPQTGSGSSCSVYTGQREYHLWKIKDTKFNPVSSLSYILSFRLSNIPFPFKNIKESLHVSPILIQFFGGLGVCVFYPKRKPKTKPQNNNRVKIENLQWYPWRFEIMESICDDYKK